MRFLYIQSRRYFVFGNRWVAGKCWLSRLVPLLFLALLLGAGHGATVAQDLGTISGVVVSTWDGTPLPNVTVTLRGTTLAAQSDAGGRFELKNIPPGEHVLRFSRTGFATAVVTDTRVVAGQVTSVNGHLRPEFYEMEEYEVAAEAFTEQSERIILERQQSSAMIDALGSDFLTRVGAGNAAESLTKIAGATVVEGRSAVVRGLNDRYIATTLNGANIPSADPYRQSASLDLFPSQVIDRVVVSKTFTPDQPGTFTGGGIDIVTKSFPERPFFTFTVGTGYNTQASLNQHFLTYDGSPLDWAAMGSAARALPPEVNSQAPIHPPPPGALSPPIIGNVSTNNPNYQGQYVLDNVTRELGVTQFAPKEEKSPVNYNFAGSGGGSVKVFDGKFGYFAGVSYKQDYAYYEDGISRRYWQGTQTNNSYLDTRGLSVVNWSAMVNLAYQPMQNHEIAFTFFYNQNGTDDSRIQDNGYSASDTTSVFRKFNLYYIERNLNTYQMRGNHSFPDTGNLQFNWLVALTGATQQEPDARFFNDFNRGSGYITGNPAPNPSDPTRYYRDLEENNLNARLDWTLPFKNWTSKQANFRFGFYDNTSKRTFTERQFYYKQGGIYNNDPNLYLKEATLGAHPTTNAAGRVNFHWGQYAQVFDSLYDGDRDILAGYAMVELPLLEALRLVGGARYEATDLRVHSESYLQSSVTGEFINNSTIVQGDLLPALGLIYQFNKKMDARFNFSQTIARPSFRELAAYYAYDPIIDEFVEGNPLLVMAAINNYDLRWEWYPRPNDLLSASLFYKTLQNAIERGDRTTVGDVITYLNREEATLYGIELEGRLGFDFITPGIAPLSIGGNIALVKSEVNLTTNELNSLQQFFPDASATRPLYDQSPYIINFDLTYNNPTIGTTASIVYNVVGPRIVLTKLNTEDVYEQPVPILDFIVSQSIGKHTTVRFAARNLLDPLVERTYGKSGDLLYSSYKRGRLFTLSLNFSF